MNAIALLAATTGKDAVSNWLRTDLVVIIMSISGGHVLMRLVAFLADQQIIQVKSRNKLDASDLSALTTARDTHDDDHKVGAQPIRNGVFPSRGCQ